MSFNNARDRQESRPEDGPVRYLPCRVCATSTMVETLSMYGAMCARCYEGYCNPGDESRRYRKPDPERLRAYFAQLADGIRERRGNPRAWADDLRAREEAGEVLSITQGAT